MHKSEVDKYWGRLYSKVTGDEDKGRLSLAMQWGRFLEEQYAPREYHNLAHPGYMLSLLNLECRDQAKDPLALEWAIWFHDVVHFTRLPMSGWNEQLSAEISGLDKNLTPTFIWKVRNLIIATSHKGRFLDSDCALIRDLDLAVLGMVERGYDVYEARVRKEYEWVPEEIWRVERVKVLQGFLDRDGIYETDFWRDQREDQARSNLTRAIDKLTK